MVRYRQQMVLAAAAAAAAACTLVAVLPGQRTWAAPSPRGLVEAPPVRVQVLGAGRLAALPTAKSSDAAFAGSAWGHAAACSAVLCALALAQRGSPRGVRMHADERLGYRISGAPGRPGSPHAWTEPIRWIRRFKRRISIRKRIEGTCARPRLAVFRSQQHIHVNVVDDTIGKGITLITSTTKQKHNLEEIQKTDGAEDRKGRTWTLGAAEIIGKDVAKQCLEKKITQVVFDRGGFRYDGRVKAVAEAARSAGLQF